MRAALFVCLVACAGGLKPVTPPIHDRVIVFGQRIGPVTLGMSEAELIEAVGKPSGEQSYGGNRRSVAFPDLKLHVVFDVGRVVFIAPLDSSYATASGLHVGSKEAELSALNAPFTKKEKGTTISYCYSDGTLVTVAGALSSPEVCAPGTVCDVAVGGCKP